MADSPTTTTTTTTKTPNIPTEDTTNIRAYQDPFVECFFGVEFGDSALDKGEAYFRAISGGEMSISLIQHNVVYQNGGSTTLFIPGPTSFEPITLYQGVTTDMAVWKWWTNVTRGKKVRKTVTIRAYGHIIKEGGSATVAEWTLENAWPLVISGFNFDLDSGEAFVAAITLVAESIERKL